MRRSYEELKHLFDVLEQDYDLSSSSEREFRSRFLMHLKVCTTIYGVLYPCDKMMCVVKDSYGDIFYGGIYDEEDFEYIVESKVSCGYLTDYALAYIKESPFWDKFVCGLYVDWYEDGVEVNEDNGNHFVGRDYLKKLFNDFLEEDIYSSEDKLAIIRSLFEVGDDFPDDLCVIKCELYPYLSLFKEKAGSCFPEEVEYLEKAFYVVSSWMNGRDERVCTDKYAYFFSMDDSSEAYGMSYGCLLHKLNVVVSFELIEEIMFSLDKVFHILPKEILRKEEERWKEKI